MRGIWFLIACRLLAAADDPTGSIRGAVVDAVTKQPVHKATVSLQLMMAASTPAPAAATISPAAQLNQNQPKRPQTLTTDLTGVFRFDQIQPGVYKVMVRHPAYPQNQQSISAGKSFVIKAGDSAGPVSVELIPGAALSGHLLDEDGDPLTGCNIQLHPAKHPEQNAQSMSNGQPGGGEKGDYRLYGIPPGKYLARATCQARAFQPRPLSPGPDPPPAFAYPSLWYPNSSTIESAEVITLTPGMERSGVDFRIKPVAVTRIHVTLAGDEWRGRRDLSWSLLPIGQRNSSGNSGMRQINTSTGAFDINQVFPGSYNLVVATPQMVQQNGASIAAVQRVDVTDKPLQITMSLQRAVDLTGTVRIESPDGGAPLSPGQVRLQISPEEPTFMRQGPPVAVQNDGTFSITSLLPISSRVRVITPFGFLKSAVLDNTEASGGRLDLAASAGGQLRIVISTNTATLRGSAPAGTNIQLTALDGNLYASTRGTDADASGQFSIASLAPGKYLLTTDQGGAASEDEGIEITLGEGESRTVEIKAK